MMIVGLVAIAVAAISYKKNPLSNSSNSNIASPVIIHNSSYDGSVLEVRFWLEKHVSNPSSLEFLGWSGVTESKEGGYWVSCKYKTKDSQGADVVEYKRFHLDAKGNVIESIDEVATTPAPLFNSTTLPPKSNSIIGSSQSVAVINSGWDGSVWQVKKWMKNNLKDPDSLQFIEWSPVAKDNKGDYWVRCKYRAKNSFGGYAIENTAFHLDSQGNVIDVGNSP